jgi:hypothetical protein
MLFCLSRNGNLPAREFVVLLAHPAATLFMTGLIRFVIAPAAPPRSGP